jgi:hypothetical protein
VHMPAYVHWHEREVLKRNADVRWLR